MLIPFGTMKRQFSSILCLMGLVFIVSCSDDDKDYPSLVSDFLVASTDANGKITTVRLDKGTTYDIAAQGISTNAPDTLLRCIASYTLDGDKMTMYNISHIFSENPVPARSLLMAEDGTQLMDTLPRDPMKVVSLWKDGGYINMQLGMLTTGVGTHAYAFCEDSVGHYSLVHLRPQEDAESYTQKVYMSMPIPDSVGQVTFSIYTYDGIFTRTF